jgi:predicted methyltransferase
MNAAVFAAPKRGDIYGVIDHSARAGAGTSETKTLHRIEESAVVAEIEKAGFMLDGSADFLRNPSDARDWNASPSAAGERRGTSDRFVLKFCKS